jgi:formate hydrogenlyase subunit 3/multisubunit Na+/H+ antiporter MnhD subunit
MLWYGYIFFFFAFFLTLISVITAFRLFYLNLLFKYDLITFLIKSVLGVFFFLLTISLTVLYYLLDYFSTFQILYTSNGIDLWIFDYYCYDYLIGTKSLNLNLLSIYYFPFIYIFILITILSILFCLAYNLNELILFIFYCTLILTAGYLLFFTDSLILFFLAYELLLVPSFFILYNFAKTRRCVEAAYLMFFWTQFGALFLIFSFIYIFFLCGTSSFSTLTLFFFSPFELNFLFFC